MSERVRRYRIGGVASRTGLSEHVIRAWERRYGVPAPQRSAGKYRLYTEDDVRLLQRLRELTEDGVPISQAVDVATGRGAEVPEPKPVRAAAGDGAQLHEWREAILTAARRLDQRAVEEVLDQALSALPPLIVYEGLMVPVLRHVGDEWGSGRLGVAEEHLVSQAVRTRLVRLLHAAPPNGRRHVVCACFPEDQHEIGLLGAALRFRAAGFRVTYLGARTPAAELTRVLRELRPDIVALSCVQDPGARATGEVMREIARHLPRGTRLVVGGRGAEHHPRAVKGVGILVRDAKRWAEALA